MTDDDKQLAAQRAWQAALLDLQLSTSSATYKTRIDGAHLVAFRENTFHIGCSSDNQAWLADRLTTSLTRSLNGFMGRSVQVVFQKDGYTKSDDAPVDQPASSRATPQVCLETLARTLPDTIMDPDRVVRLPVYLFRWLPYVGAQTIFVVAALQQEYYLSRRAKDEDRTHLVSARAEAICRWAGLSRATFFRMLQSPRSSLAWFLSRQETGHEYDRRIHHSKKSANAYTLFDLPLTPGDAEDLASFLLAQGIKDNPEAVLQAALTARPAQILCHPCRLPSPGFAAMPPRLITVQGVVCDLIGQPLSGQLSRLCDLLADRLQNRDAFIMVSWYFLQNWLPCLGPDAAMFVLLLRSQCYYNHQSGERRDEVWMDGGYKEIADRLGLDHPRRVATWLPPWVQHENRQATLSARSEKELQRRGLLQQALAQFVRRIDCRTGVSGRNGWKFKVASGDPLLPQHQALVTASIAFLEKAMQNAALEEVSAWVTHINQADFSHNQPETMSVLRQTWMPDGCSDTLKGIFRDCFDTLDLDAPGCFETLLKILKSFKDTEEEKTTIPAEDSRSTSENADLSKVQEVDFPEQEWSLPRLLAKAGDKKRMGLLEQEKSARPFISWLIHGASQPAVQDPYSLAIARLSQNPGVGAGGACDRLAALPPPRLVSLIELAVSYQPVMNTDWRQLFSRASRERILLLRDHLELDHASPAWG